MVRAHEIAAWLRRRSDDAKDEVLAITGELATIARASVKEAQVVAINARRSLRRAGDVAKGRPLRSSSSSRGPSRCSKTVSPRLAVESAARCRRAPPGRVFTRHRRPAHKKGSTRSSR